ncbi:MAG: DinB family protein [Saprospiraceae bacterium]|nr:DinB family protein [Saprospiraceae bacterium]
MKRSDIQIASNYFDRYIQKIPDVSWREALREYGPKMYNSAGELFFALGDKVYEEGKWTIKQIIQHVIDTERIMMYRALCFARREQQMLPGFDENAYADQAKVSHRSLYSLLEEYEVVRQSGLIMFESFTAEDLMAKGNSNDTELSVLSLAFINAGHAVHHMEIIRDRYFPLIK